jgi:tyrosinase
MKKPSRFDQTLYSGAKTRYDDFVAVHINQTLSIHGTGNFLSWHRYYVWTFEKALRNECGYTGYQPASPLVLLVSHPDLNCFPNTNDDFQYWN